MLRMSMYIKNYFNKYFIVPFGVFGDYSIGLYEGKDINRLIENSNNPVISRKRIGTECMYFVADPFIVKHKSIYYVFYEKINLTSSFGEIGLSISRDLVRWEHRDSVLKEEYHMSYPFVFDFQGDYYMIPESSAAKNVCLYKAVKFPNKWEKVRVLFDDVEYVDSSIVFLDNSWYFFTTEMNKREQLLFYSDNLLGNFRLHPCSPICKGRYARMGGRIIQVGKDIFRFAQDSFPSYGSCLAMFKILDISEDTYCEKICSPHFFEGSSKGWNSLKMHHIDPFYDRDKRKWIAVADGYSVSFNNFNKGIVNYSVRTFYNRMFQRFITKR